MSTRAQQNVIGIDLGGTKVAAALVSPQGRILRELKQPSALGGWPVLRAQLIRLCLELIAQSARPVKAVGIGSAGPLHAPSGMLLDPTNFGWKKPLKVPIARELARALKKPVALENDAAAAALAEHWKGRAGSDFAVVTLGTGLGLGVVCNGNLVRGGRALHGEGGHLLLHPGDRTALCGCGNYGCAEAYLSGVNFARRACATLGRPLGGQEIALLARAGNPRARKAFAEYSDLLALYLQNLVVLYYPRKIVLTGSFAAAAPLFLTRARKELRALLARRLKTLPLLPELRVSPLGNRSGVLGAAYLALHPGYAERQLP